MLSNIKHCEAICKDYLEFQEEVCLHPHKSARNNPCLETAKKESTKNLDYIQKEVKEKQKILSELC